MKRFIIVVKGQGLTRDEVLEEMKKTNLEVDDISDSMFIAKTTQRKSF